MEGFSKITARHLARTGYVYIRQSTGYQVASNTESTLRQYALRDRLIALGWDEAMIKIIDADLGVSGKSADNREGFMALMADVANGKAGSIACIEASRLSRCSSDWSRLIEICAMTETLIIDTDGIYSPNDFNDRLLLGLKGTMSEAELHFLQERMRGGLLNKAKRGELKRFLPIGYEYDCEDNVVKTPDQRVRHAVEQFFELFRQKKTASSVVSYYRKNGISFPVRIRRKGHSGEIRWECMNTDRAVALLHNPFYTGAYVYGRTQTKWLSHGKRRPVPVPEEEWHANIPNHHEAYISKEEFSQNQSILAKNTQRWSSSDKNTSPREGTALIQGICYCGYCGYRMAPIYGTSQSTGQLIGRYVCTGTKKDGGPVRCQQSIPTDIVDKVVSEIVIKTLEPEALSQTLLVQEEVARRSREHLKYFELQLESAKHEEDLARTRYMSVDPSNRLVALQLETEWNKKIRLHEEALTRYNEETAKAEISAGNDLAKAASSIGKNFSRVWSDPNTRNEDKKRIVRYLIKDVTLLRTETYSAKVSICFQGGASYETKVTVPKPRYMCIATPKEVLDFMEKHAETCNYAQLAEKLNASGLSRECGRPFNRSNVFRIMKDYHIKNMKQRYLDRGWLTIKEAASLLGISAPTLRYRIKSGKYCTRTIVVEESGTLLIDPETIPLYHDNIPNTKEECIYEKKILGTPAPGRSAELV